MNDASQPNSERTATPEGEVIVPANTLKAKVGDGTGFDPETIARAQRAVDTLSDSFADELGDIISELAALVKTASKDPGRRDDSIRRIYQLVFDLKGHGATFDYPLITRIGNSLCRFAEALPAVADVDLEVVKAHVDALLAVAAQKITGDGGATGKAVVKGLEIAVEKFGQRDRADQPS